MLCADRAQGELRQSNRILLAAQWPEVQLPGTTWGQRRQGSTLFTA